MSPTVRDRTLELFSTVKSFQSHLSSNKQRKPKNSGDGCTGIATDSQIVEISDRISHQSQNILGSMQLANDRIQSLEKLAKSTTLSLHDARPAIQQLTVEIKLQYIDPLKNDIDIVERIIRQRFDTSDINKDNCVSHHYAMLDILKHRYSQLAKHFGNTCVLSTQSLQLQKAQRDKFGGTQTVKFREVPRNRRQRRRTATNGANLIDDDENGSERAPLLLASGNEQGQLMMHQESDYNEMRAQDAQFVEQQLTEISQQMTTLAQMVEEQRHTVLHINTNVDDSIAHMEGAIEQLQKYLSSLAGNRWLMIKVFFILIVFAVIFTLFIA